MTKICNGVLLVVFLNTGVLILIVNANLSEAQVIPLLGRILHGRYDDYSPSWF